MVSWFSLPFFWNISFQQVFWSTYIPHQMSADHSIPKLRWSIWSQTLIVWLKACQWVSGQSLVPKWSLDVLNLNSWRWFSSCPSLSKCILYITEYNHWSPYSGTSSYNYHGMFKMKRGARINDLYEIHWVDDELYVNNTTILIDKHHQISSKASVNIDSQSSLCKFLFKERCDISCTTVTEDYYPCCILQADICILSWIGIGV